MGLFDSVPGQQVFGAGLPSYEDLQGCIRCGRCLPVCPTYQQTQLEMFSPRGRLSLLRAVEDGKLDLTAGVEEHLYHCLDCRACNTVCPPGVHIGELIVHGRVAIEEKRPRPWLMKFMLQYVLIGAERAEIRPGARPRPVRRVAVGRPAQHRQETARAGSACSANGQADSERT
jgi:Fe-S oxidoreductase